MLSSSQVIEQRFGQSDVASKGEYAALFPCSYWDRWEATVWYTGDLHVWCREHTCGPHGVEETLQPVSLCGTVGFLSDSACFFPRSTFTYLKYWALNCFGESLVRVPLLLHLAHGGHTMSLKTPFDSRADIFFPHYNAVLGASMSGFNV